MGDVFYKVSMDKETLKDGGNGTRMFFPNSGIYKVTIDTMRVEVNKNGARHLHLKLKNDNNQQQYLFSGIKLDQNNGKKHFQSGLLDKLCVIAGIDSLNMPVTQSRMWLDSVAKKDTLQVIDVLDQFDDFEVRVKIIRNYTIWNDEIREEYIIDNFYRDSDGATAMEIASGLEPGVQLEKDLALVKDKYSNGLTIEEVEEWKKNGFGKNKREKEIKPDSSLSNPFSK